ncbi:heme-binding protein [Paraburkholderia strydomiana]|uniref:Heme-binding protein n=1 Tax=Paraburkholderia strydomiana TaxID=1245417 RepID=A0ABW9ES31_9BURK
MAHLSLSVADAIIRAALGESRRLALKPMTVAVLDAGGHMIACSREDGSGFLRFELATGKAYGALGFGFGSRGLQDKSPTFLAGAIAASGGRLVPAAGGIVIREDSGFVLGAIGVSGDTSEADEAVGLEAVREVGLRGDIGT